MTTLLSPLRREPQAKAPARAGLRQYGNYGYQSTNEHISRSLHGIATNSLPEVGR